MHTLLLPNVSVKSLIFVALESTHGMGFNPILKNAFFGPFLLADIDNVLAGDEECLM